MELSLEIPIAHTGEFLPLCDFAFGLAHLIIDTETKELDKYREHMHGCLLDNSMYERDNEPLSNENLMEAARICEPSSLIAPDWMSEMDHTLTATFSLRDVMPYNAVVVLGKVLSQSGPQIGGVVQGKDLEERLKCFRVMQDAKFSPICFPFRTPRHETIGSLLINNELKQDEWYHLLGLQDMHELKWKLPGRWSVDTSKPFKPINLSRDAIRGHTRLDLDETLPIGGLRMSAWNIAYMRKEMR